ncbi:hypothetical protein Afer_1388 [Acidimicrobium ferrooxidans DSM 10331]|uniref:AAA family ATPase n=1 Tax=Acidimicrobium ferrooxidans (strain DSM 10331 / JCM 15462 / NBRC 103882 / ICP) TaxID=525909 RepID=C7M006_ACIFD|nr:AAA family ATPase [Acidimicrobium ferrooxidans]ACU54314.1 hypothetical protein Afer_1388 [Acidimicrobium ferrooxidans DSM 10331]
MQQALLQLAARLCRGELPGALFGQPAVTLDASSEDNATSVLGPRYLAAGGDPRMLGFTTVPVSFPADFERLRRTVLDNHARLVIVEPLSGALGGRVDTHRDADVRAVLGRLRSIACDAGATIVGIGHLTKASGAAPLDRLLGSRAFPAAARSVLLLGSHGDVLALASVKSSYGLKPTPLGLAVEGRTLEVDDKQINTSTVRLLGVP